MEPVAIRIDSSRGLARVTLNRPDRRNAFDDRMAEALSQAFQSLGQNPSVRAVILAGAGPVFCGGADLRWMRSNGPPSESQAEADAKLLTRMFSMIDSCPCPVIGRVQGPAYGGGVGLLAVCDVVVAVEDATFALSEVTLGLIPAIIAPWLLRKTGESFARRYCLTGEPFSAVVGQQFNLIHEVTGTDSLDKRIEDLAETILRLAPNAVRETKTLLKRLAITDGADHHKLCADANVRARRSAEAQEGLQAFLKKRRPSWVVTNEGVRD